MTVIAEMNFALPEIEKANCKSFTACARVVTKNKLLSKFFESKRASVASIKQARSQRFVHLGTHKGGYLHLDVATPAYFEGRWNPKPTHTWTEVQTVLSRFAGQRIQVRCVGVFLLPFDSLPESSPIRALSVESTTPKMSMKLTGGTFSVAGAPIERISWSLLNDGRRIELRLRSTLELTVNELYLVDSFRLLNDSLQVFVLGDEKKSNQF
jgi:hypothetical protein